jgi:hypothetical protein
MQRWKTAGPEPSLDELLDDEVMVPLMQSAGLSAEDIRTLVMETAERLADARTALGRKYIVRSVMPPDDRRDADRLARTPQ